MRKSRFGETNSPQNEAGRPPSEGSAKGLFHLQEADESFGFAVLAVLARLVANRRKRCDQLAGFFFFFFK